MEVVNGKRTEPTEAGGVWIRWEMRTAFGGANMWMVEVENRIEESSFRGFQNGEEDWERGGKIIKVGW